MPKSADVEDFAAKLALLVKRLNWSRAKLAQQVGVDKSLAARWMSGSRPTGNSLMQLTTAVAQVVDGFTGADWDLPTEEFGQRIGLRPGPGAVAPPAESPSRLVLSGLREPPPPELGAAFLGLWAGFYQSATNRSLARLCYGEFSRDAHGTRLTISDGYFVADGQALATTPSQLHCILEIRELANYLALISFNARRDTEGAAIVDGIWSAFGADGVPMASPVILFRIDEGDVAPAFKVEAMKASVSDINHGIEREALSTGDPIAAMRHLAPPDIMGSIWPAVGTPRADGQTDHILRWPATRSFAAGPRLLESLHPEAPQRIVRGNLRRALGLDPQERIRLVHPGVG